LTLPTDHCVVTLTGVCVEYMSEKRYEMFGVKEEVVEEVKVKKPRKKAKAVVLKKSTVSKAAKTVSKGAEKKLTVVEKKSHSVAKK